MRNFHYGDEQIGERELMIALPSMVIGAGILDLPRHIAAATIASDGWIPLLIGGGIAAIIVWLAAKLASGFPNQTFLSYSSAIITKPVSIVLTLIFAVISLLIAAFVIRTIALIAKMYLFERTPIEILAFAFFLVVIYAVSGSRAGLFRLNMMFFPIIIFIMLVVLFFVLRWFDLGNLLPVFKTDFTGYIKGTKVSSVSYVGSYIILFYMFLVKQPKRTPKMAVFGMCFPIALYIMIFLFCIAVFGHSGTADLQYPTLELAKRVEIPGGIFERVESVFFVIWMMAIFNTTAMAFDVTVLALNSVFKKWKKIWIVLVLSPIIYYISMTPKNYIQLGKFATFISYSALIFTFCVTVLLLIIRKIRGVKQVE